MSMRMTPEVANVDKAKFEQLQARQFVNEDTPGQIRPVKLFIDFDGTLTKLPAKSCTNEDIPHHSWHRNDDWDEYTGAGANIHFAPELIDGFKQLFERNLIEWYWNTSNQGVTDWYEKLMGIASYPTTELQPVDPITQKAKPLYKAGELIRQLDTEQSRGCRFIWIDDDCADQYTCNTTRITEMVRHNDLTGLVIKPNPHTGINRFDWRAIQNFIYDPNGYEHFYRRGTIHYIHH